MKYDLFTLEQNILGIDGLPVFFGDKIFKVRDAFRQALNGVFANEQPTQQNPEGITLEARVKRFEIAKKIWNCDTILDLSSDEVTELKKCCGKMFPTPEVIGFLDAVIEGKDTGIKPFEKTAASAK